VTDPAAVSLLAEAKVRMAVRKPIAMIRSESIHTPALFGWRKPCLLLPQRTLVDLEQNELRMVLLHELAHVKRQDILLNWLMIFARALHWFNPFVWVAMRRLAADRELVCDAMVLRVLDAEQRRLYGNTLLKLLADFSAGSLCPSLVPVVNHKQEIKRRIMMISQFKPTPRTAWLLAAALAVALCILTFTKAADPAKKPPATTDQAGQAESNRPEATVTADHSDLERLQKRLDIVESRIRAQEDSLDKLRVKMGGVGLAEGVSSTVDDETARGLQRERIAAQAHAAQYQKLCDELRAVQGKSFSELTQALPGVVPDTELTRLLGDLHQTEVRLASLAVEFGSERPEVKQVKAALETLEKQIKERVSGIFKGLEAQAAAQNAMANDLAKQLRELASRDAKNTEESARYFRAKRDLDMLLKIREMLMEQLLQKQFLQEGP
jgi:bla regulator protein BlaR1